MGTNGAGTLKGVSGRELVRNGDEWVDYFGRATAKGIVAEKVGCVFTYNGETTVCRDYAEAIVKRELLPVEVKKRTDIYATVI